MSVGKNLAVGTAIAVVVATAAVFAVAPMYTGRLIEQDFRTSIAKSAGTTPGGLQASVETYDRGWRSSTAITHWTIPDINVDFRLRHEITHGPSPQFAVARVETTPVIPTSAQVDVDRVFKGPPLTATTLIGSGGDVHTTIVSPAVAMTQTKNPNVQVGWGGLNAVLTQQGDQYTLTGEIPAIHVADSVKNERMSISGIRIDGNTRINGSAIALVGAAGINIGAMELTSAETGAVKVGATRIASRSDERGDVLDMQFAFSNDGISSAGGSKPPLQIKKLELEYRMRNLDKAAYEKYQKDVSTLFAGAGDKEALAAEAMAKTMTAANDLLRGVAARSPIIEVPKFHVALEQGAVDGTLTANFNGSGLATWPPSMDEALRRTTVNATLRAPEPLLRMIAETRARESAVQMLAMQGTEASEDNIRTASATIVDQQMQMLAQMPYLKREGNDYSSTLTLQNGELKVNGQLIFGGAAGTGLGGLIAPPADGLAVPPEATAPMGN